MKKKFIGFLILMLLLQKSDAQKDFVQQILLDKPVIAGKLKVFPSFGADSNKYYYLPNKIRMATDDRGIPKFLFLYYVTNQGSGDAEELALVGRTGGYVHLVAGLHVLPEELDEAKMELKRVNPKGVIMGPVIYRGGTMSLVTKSVITNSSSSNPDPNQKRVLGIGPAPVIEGDNIAVSFVLDSLDAKIMWESLQTPTPDISFNLNMTIGGFQSPLSFKIDMDFDKIYQHKIFNAGLATPFLKAEIGVAAQQLQENGAIKITQVGEDPNMQKLQETILNKFLEMCFVPFGGEGSPNWTELGKTLNDGKSYLDRASEALEKERQRVEETNREIRAANLAKEMNYQDLVARKEEQERQLAAAEREVQRKQAAVDEQENKVKGDHHPFGIKADEDELRRRQEELDDAQQEADEKESTVKDYMQAIKDFFGLTDSTGTEAPDTTTKVKPTTTKPATTKPETKPTTTKPETKPTTTKPRTDTTKTTTPKDTTRTGVDRTGGSSLHRPIKFYFTVPDTIPAPKYEKEKSLPTVAVVASYQQKKIRHTGHFVAEAKTYFTTTLAEPFGDNIGRIKCKDCIRKINTYDPLYVQREVVCFLDGQLSNDFDKYVNFVTVSMRKTHAGGDVTTQEVRVDRRNFNKEGNRFKLLYGWMKGDDDRKDWLSYEYKTTWNFFGGATVEGEWKATDLPVIPLSPPVKKYTVFFDADPDRLKENNIRAVTVRVFYSIGGIEQMRQMSMNTARGVTSVSLDYLLPGNETEFEYEIEWVKGNTNVKSPRKKTSQTTIYVDEIQ
jgi:hypothetical protein